MDRLRFSQWVEDDLVQALAWYDAKSPQLGNDFRSEVETAFNAIEREPNRFAVVGPNRRIRYVKLHRFPYVVFYRNTSAKRS